MKADSLISWSTTSMFALMMKPCFVMRWWTEPHATIGQSLWKMYLIACEKLDYQLKAIFICLMRKQVDIRESFSSTRNQMERFRILLLMHEGSTKCLRNWFCRLMLRLLTIVRQYDQVFKNWWRRRIKQMIASILTTLKILLQRWAKSRVSQFHWSFIHHLSENIMSSSP